MPSKVEVINTALVSLNADTVSLPTEDSEVGRRVIAVYDIHLRAILRNHPWSFAKNEAVLSLVDETPILSDDYTYKFTLPPDFVKLLKTDVESVGYSHKIKGKRLYSNSNAVKIEYIYFNDDPNSWDDSFVAAFAAKLAFELAFPITGGDKNMIELKGQEYVLKLREAKALNGQEITPDESTENEYLNSRT